MANKKAEIMVNAIAGEEIYICGNIPQLGSWNPEKAVALKKNDKGLYEVTKMLPADQIIEFKILKEKSWDYVEKGQYDEEIKNHMMVLPAEEPLVFYVAKFNK